MSPDSFDADLHPPDPVAEGHRTVLMERLGADGPGFAAARDRLAQQLSGARFETVDEATGVFEITLEAADLESAVKRVFDAMAAAGADDHMVIAEHPEIEGHWITRGQEEKLPPPTA